MKVITGCAVLLVSAVVASANLLTNPGLETDSNLTGWEQSGWYVGTGADAHSGSNGAAYWTPSGRPSGDYYVALQYVPVTAGQTYDVSAWMRTVSFNTSEAFVEVDFNNASGGFTLQTNTAPVGGVTAYNQYSLNGLIAPAGSLSASVRAVVHTTGATADNAWYTFDDFQFNQVVPEPGTLALCLMGMGFGSILVHRRRRNG